MHDPLFGARPTYINTFQKIMQNYTEQKTVWASTLWIQPKELVCVFETRKRAHFFTKGGNGYTFFLLARNVYMCRCFEKVDPLLPASKKVSPLFLVSNNGSACLFRANKWMSTPFVYCIFKSTFWKTGSTFSPLEKKWIIHFFTRKRGSSTSSPEKVDHPLFRGVEKLIE